jgi:hypothetical protein
MAFDPTVPAVNANLDANPIRDNFNALKGLIDAIPTSAGGDLGGSYPNPTVQSIANVTTGPAVYPAGDGSQLTNLPAPSTLCSGVGTLNGAGVYILNGLPPVTAIVVSWLNAPGTGVLYNNTFSSIQSSAGSADAGLEINWIAF